MSFYGVIRPGYAKQDRSFWDEHEFGRFWDKVRDDPEAHNWVVVDQVTFGWPKAKGSKQGRVTSTCRHCSREFVSHREIDGTDLWCYGCLAADMAASARMRKPTDKAQYCPALMGSFHSFKAGLARCQHCLRTKEQIGLTNSKTVEHV